MALQIVAGLVLSSLVGLVGYWRGSLAPGGALGAVITGTVIFGFAGPAAGVLLVTFFVSSSALSHFRARSKSTLASRFQKGSRRDLGQALANGGWPAVQALLFGLVPSPLIWAAFVGSVATVTADTWATEVGVLSPIPPRLIMTLKRVAAGTSGGLTVLGTLAALAGASCIGVVAFLLFSIGSLYPALDLALSIPPGPGSTPFQFLWLAAGSGLVGAFFDSFLGATLQASYYCDYDSTETESRVHSCGRSTRLIRGFSWLENDVVNLLSSVFGSGVAALLWLAL